MIYLTKIESETLYQIRNRIHESDDHLVDQIVSHVGQSVRDLIWDQRDSIALTIEDVADPIWEYLLNHWNQIFYESK